MDQERQARMQINAERGILTYSETREIFAALDAARADNARLATDLDNRDREIGVYLAQAARLARERDALADVVRRVLCRNERSHAHLGADLVRDLRLALTAVADAGATAP